MYHWFSYQQAVKASSMETVTVFSYGTSGKKLLSLLFRTSLKRTNLFAQENNQSFWCGSNSL